jgi:hypothetical protein
MPPRPTGHSGEGSQIRKLACGQTVDGSLAKYPRLGRLTCSLPSKEDQGDIGNELGGGASG